MMFDVNVRKLWVEDDKKAYTDKSREHIVDDPKNEDQCWCPGIPIIR